MNGMWNEFDDFELACLCHDYGIGDICEFEQILPIKLSNRAKIEEALTQFELDMAFGE